MPRSDEKKPARFADLAHQWGDPVLFTMAGFLEKLGFTPNALTWLALMIAALAAGLFAAGELLIGGWIYLLAMVLDILDGPLARRSSQQTDRGSFLDATLDQFSDALVFLGLIAHFAAAGQTVELLLAAATISGALLVSYVKAKAITLGKTCRIGPVGRFERGVILTVGLLSGQVSIMLWVAALLVNFTAVYRFIYVLRQFEDGGQ
jgi:phosphatidylglycerophosphate synthase